ncbi:uncharacterized protein LOC142768868 [Rhipicephalus microplus]|uniref:uncharacterized protein LOC142768868 n=1 Tax=Rhipicephalus microplus TaxID=6941 RepID=UPI003F6CF166
MELVKEFGDSRALLLEEDHIVFKLETPWPQDVPVPEGLSLANENGLLLVSKQGSLILAAKNAMPFGVKIAKALFCGCVSFDSFDIYASAATKLLKDAEEVLALPHDLRTHALEEARGVRPSALAKRSQLRELLGTTDGDSIGTQCSGGLYLKRDVMLAILRTCPEASTADACTYCYKRQGKL